MERETPPRVKKKDRTDVIISVVLHVLVLGLVLYFVSKTEVGQDILRSIGATRDKKKSVDKPKPPAAKPISKGALKPPPGAPPPASGARRAVDAPAAVGEGFSIDERKGTKERSGGGRGRTNAPVVVVQRPPAKVKPPKLFSTAAPKSDIKQLLAERAKAATSVEAFGSEQISKSGVSDAGAILKNISGATVSEGKFAVIRGLSDRYVSTTLNGADLPSADPYRRSAPLDLFPAQVIDRVAVSKTFTPDQPGAYTGGGIDIVTKSFPEKPFMNFSVGGSYNTQTTGNDDYLTYPGGKRDWLGMDDGTRALPSSLSGQDLVVPAPVFTANSTRPDYNQNVNNAETLNSQTHALGLAQFAPDQSGPPLNHNFALAFGETSHLLNRPFGVFASLNYRHDWAYYGDGIIGRYEPGPVSGEYVAKQTGTESKAVEVANWTSMVNLAYEIAEGHELGFNFLYNQFGEDLARTAQVTKPIQIPGAEFYLNRLQWTERNLSTYQLRGHHEFQDLGNLRFDWMGALSQTTQDEPDVRIFNYRVFGGPPDVGNADIPDPGNPTRYYRNLDENNSNFKLDLTQPFRQWAAEEAQGKIGYFNSSSERSFFDREFYYKGDAPWNGDPNDYLTADNLGYTARTNFTSSGNINYITYSPWKRYIETRRSYYNSDSSIQAGYAMLDVPLVDRLRLVGGLRIENTDMNVFSVSAFPNSITGKTTNNSTITQTDFLPAVGLIYSIQSNMLVRLNYSQTIARPSIRELAAYRSYDPILDELLEGNPLLRMTSAENYDARWEWYPRPGELFSFSLFYKSLENAIERRYVTIDGEIISFLNRPPSKLFGVELEVRKNLDFLDANLRNFSLGGNLSLIKSETPLTTEEWNAKQQYVPGASDTRPLYDQSPYIANVDLSYDNPDLGTRATLLFNVAGPRITIASLNTPDIYEQPAPTLDFVLSQRLARHWTVKFAARNLLNPEINRTYGEDSDLFYSSYKRGRTFGLSVGYDF
jgi:TonB-dependent receptor